MRRKLYLDTSVLGALTDPGPMDRLVATRRVLDSISRGFGEGYVSTVVLEEVERAPRSVREKISREMQKGYLMVLEESDESARLSRVYISGGAIPSEYENNARHVAIATTNNIRVIVSWNFRHMVNIDRKQKINSVNLREGLPLVDLVSPWEISYEEA